jgi:hypothetical protein
VKEKSSSVESRQGAAVKLGWAMWSCGLLEFLVVWGQVGGTPSTILKVGRAD